MQGLGAEAEVAESQSDDQRKRMAERDAAFGGVQHGAEERGQEQGGQLAQQKVHLRATRRETRERERESEGSLLPRLFCIYLRGIASI